MNNGRSESEEEKREILCSYIRENQGDLYRFAYSCVRNSEDAMDIVQEAIVKAIGAVGKLRNIDSIKPWVFRIIINEANIIFRRNKRLTYADESDESLYGGSYSDDIGEYVDRHNVIKGVFNLEEKYRIIIILRYYEELKLSEIANILHISENTVKTRLYKALKLLKDVFKED